MSITGSEPVLEARPQPIKLSLRGLSGEDVESTVHVSGAGRPVVFLHGLAGMNDHWGDSASRLDDIARSVLFQLPLLNLRRDDCSITGVVALTIRFLAERLKEPSIIVGNSFGGHVALRVALERPDLVRGLVLTGASGILERTLMREVQIRPSRAWLENKIGELFFDRSKMRAADVDRAFEELSKRHAARAMVALSRSARRNHLGERLVEISVPTLLIWGREDVVTPPEAALQFERGIRGSRLVWLEACGHAPMIECPDEFAREMRAFVTSINTAG